MLRNNLYVVSSFETLVSKDFQRLCPYCYFMLKMFADMLYEDCSNMNAGGFIAFFAYVLRRDVMPFWKELFVAFKMAPNIKRHILYFSSYRPLYKCCFVYFVRDKFS